MKEHPTTALPAVLSRPIGDEEVNAVDGREIHAFLEIRLDRSTWMARQVKSLDLVENVDFAVSLLKEENPQGGRPQKLYLFGLDAAKHIAMVSRTEKGRALRQWFIQIEKVSRERIAKPGTIEAHRLLVAHHAAALAGWEEAEGRAIAAESTVQTQAAKIEGDRGAVLWYEEQESATGTFTTAEVVQDSDTGWRLGRVLWKLLDESGDFFYTPDGGHRRFLTGPLKRGVGINLITTHKARGRQVTRITPRWTVKGSAELKVWLRDHERQGRV